jgi:uncharacterized membrane protein YhfC
MVSNISILMMTFSGIITLVLPVALAIYLYKRFQISLRALLVGALVFFVFQMTLRLPFLSWLAQMEWYKNWVLGQSWVHQLYLSIFLGVSAGVFEEIGRFLGYKYLLRNELEWKNGLAFGTGHGGIESILLVGMTMINNIMLSQLINAGKFESQIGSKLPAGVAQNIKETLINTPSWLFLMGGLERILAIIIQIGFSLLVLKGVMTKRYRYLIYAVLLHAVVDIPAGLYQMKVINVGAAEFITSIFAGVAFFWIIKSKDTFKTELE